MADGAGSGAEGALKAPDPWQNLEKGLEKIEEGMESVYASLRDLQADLSEMRADMRMAFKAFKGTVIVEKIQQEDELECKEKELKMAAREKGERKRKAAYQTPKIKEKFFKPQKDLMQFGFNNKKTVEDEVLKRKRALEDYIELEQQNIARGRGKKKKSQGDFHEKKKRDVKEEG